MRSVPPAVAGGSTMRLALLGICNTDHDPPATAGGTDFNAHRIHEFHKAKDNRSHLDAVASVKSHRTSRCAI